ncbi:MAG: actin family protein [Archangium sp.]|nr:actin family protein [Archangium sp.]
MGTPQAGDEVILFSIDERRFLALPTAGTLGTDANEPVAFPDVGVVEVKQKALDDANAALDKAQAAVDQAVGESAPFLMMPNAPQAKKAKKKVDAAKKDRDGAEKAVTAAKAALNAAKDGVKAFAPVRFELVSAGGNKVALRNAAAGAFVRVATGGKADSVAGKTLDKSWKGVAFTIAASGSGVTLRADDVGLFLALSNASTAVASPQAEVFQAQVSGTPLAALAAPTAPGPSPKPSAGAVPFVVAPGSAFTRFGLTSLNAPQTAPTLVGRPKVNVSVNSGPKFGDAAVAAGATVTVSQPILFGEVSKPDDARLFLEWVARLQTAPDEHPLVLTERSGLSKDKRAFFADLAFNTLNVPSLCIVNESLMALKVTNKNTGLVLMVGDTVTTATPVVNGVVIASAVQTRNIGGRDVSSLLKTLLTPRMAFNTRAELEVLRAIKERSSKVALNFEDEFAKAQSGNTSGTHTFEDGEKLSMHGENLKGPEVLFQPSLAGGEVTGVANLSFESISECATDVRAGLFANVVLAGGSAKFPGFAERLKKDLAALGPEGTVVTVSPAGSQLENAAWLGAAAFARADMFAAASVTRAEYLANPSVISTRFP